MSQYQTVFNTSADALVVSTESRVIGGYEWGNVDPDDDKARALMDSGVLIEASEPNADAEAINPDAQQAFDTVDSMDTRESTAASLPKDTLLDVIEEKDPDLLASLPVGGDGKPSKATLVEAIVENPKIDLPTSDTKGARGNKQKEA